MKSKLPKIFSGIASPLGLVLLILFFLPWTELSCQGSELGHANGWQLMVGDINDQPMKDLMSQMEDGMEGTMEESEMEVEGEGEELAEAEVEAEEEGIDVDARPLFILALLAPIVVLVVGLLGVMGRMGDIPVGLLLCAMAIIGVIMVFSAVAVDYSQDESISSDDSAEEQQQVEVMETKTRPAVWVSFALYLVVLFLGAGIFMARFMRRL